MSELGRSVPERLVKQNLWRSVDHVVAAARNERDAHGDIVDDRTEVVERNAVGANQDEVLLRGVRRRHASEYEILVGHGTVVGARKR